MSLFLCILFSPFIFLFVMMVTYFVYCFYEFLLDLLGLENPIPIVFEYISEKIKEIKKVIDKIISKW